MILNWELYKRHISRKEGKGLNVLNIEFPHSARDFLHNIELQWRYKEGTSTLILEMRKLELRENN